MANKCPKCHSENPETQGFCGACGTQLPPPKDHPPVMTETLQTPVHELTTGSTFAGRYQVIEELGHGGMGRVYKVQDTKIGEKIALKLIRPEAGLDKKSLDRFSNELKLARKIRHKNVCQMFDLGEDQGTRYITMEYVHGEDLKQLIRKVGRLSPGQSVGIARQVCDGLEEAHKLGVVHRDLKPQNIMVDEDGKARIMDFGIARSLSGKSMTGAGVMIGTPEYMSPEQVEGKDIDQRSDIYSLGIILYEMITGRLPFIGETPISVAHKHKYDAPEDPKKLNTQVSDDLARVILKCLAKDEGERFQSAAELGAELGRIEEGLPTTARLVAEKKTVTSRVITVKFTLRKLLFPALGLVVLAVAVLFVIRFRPRRQFVPPPSGKPSLAVLYFENISGDRTLDPWKTGLTELFIAKLYQSKFIDVLSTDRILSILKNLNLQGAQKYSADDLLNITNLGPTTYTLTGSLMKAGKNIIITLTLQRPATREVISTLNTECHGEEEMFAKVDELAKSIKSDLKLSPNQINADMDTEAGKITTSSAEAYKYYSLGRESYNKYEWEQSIAFMEKAVALDPDFAMAYRSMAEAYGNLESPQKARTYFEKAMELSGRVSERERSIIQGTYYARSDMRTEKAIETFEKVLKLYPDNELSRRYLASLYWGLGDLDKAQEQYEFFVKQRNPSDRYYRSLAAIYESKGMDDKAREVLEGYAKDFSDSAALRRDIANIYLYEGKYDLAQSEADRASSMAPTDYENVNLNGTIYILKGNPVEAENEFRKIIEMAPKENKFSGYFGLACLYESIGNFQKSIDQFKKGLEFGPIASHAYSAWLYIAMNEFTTALKECDEARQKAVETKDAWGEAWALETKCVVYIKMKSLDKAQKTFDEDKELYKKLMNKKDETGLLLRFQGYFELEKKNYSKAIESLNKSILYLNLPDLSGLGPIIYDSLAQAYSGAGDLENARRAYEKIASFTLQRFLNEDYYAKSFYNLGKICEKQGQKDKAKEYYRKFLDFWKDADPGLPGVEDARKRLAGISN